MDSVIDHGTASIRVGEHDLAERVLVVAEIGNNHEGDPALAAQLVRLAAEAGADAVKFQTFRPSHYVSRDDPARYARLERFALPWEEFPRLADVARDCGVGFLSTPFDPGAVELLDPLVGALKIASGDNDFTALIERAAGTGKPLLVSTGLADEGTLRRLQATVRATWAKDGIDPGLVLLHCVVSYPTADADANLRAIRDLAGTGSPVGYSDHTMGTTAAVAAVALGARVVEKHFTIAHDHSDFRDHALSATPEELADLVHQVRRVEAMLGPGGPAPRAAERANESAVRRSIVADRDLPAGHVIELKDLRWIRPGTGLRCGREGELLGRALARAVQAGEQLRPESCAPADAP